MILKASQRSGAMQLASHLLKAENEHVEIHEVRGFISDNVREAFKESEALAKGTRCIQHLFSLSLNPPERESVEVEAFEKAITDIESSLKLSGQPRIVIFHEKEGRRHCHAVWSRIDTQNMKAINLPHYKNRLMDVSKRLYLEHGWTMPEGLRDRNKRNPYNYSLAEWQQAKRAGIDPKALKQTFQECWNISDSRKAFTHALSEHGLTLAKRDRRGFVAVDYRGEVYAIARYAGIKTKDVKEKLRKPDNLPSVAEAKADISRKMSRKLQSFIDQTDKKLKVSAQTLEAKRQKLAEHHREARRNLEQQQNQRGVAEAQKRAERFRKGFRGVWDYLSGKNAKIKAQNSMETYWCSQRDRREKQNLIDRQLSERQSVQKQIRQVRLVHNRALTKLHKDIGYYMNLNRDEQEKELSLRPKAKIRPDKVQETPKPKQRSRIDKLREKPVHRAFTEQSQPEQQPTQQDRLQRLRSGRSNPSTGRSRGPDRER